MRPHPSATTVDICDYTKPEPCHKPDVRTEPILEFKASVQYIEKVKRASYFGNIVDMILHPRKFNVFVANAQKSFGKIVKVCPPWLGSKKDFRTSKSLFHHSENAFFFFFFKKIKVGRGKTNSLVNFF